MKTRNATKFIARIRKAPFGRYNAQRKKDRPKIHRRNKAMPMPPDTSPSQITALAETIFNRLAQQFPVCMGSDEFHFFPQVRATAEYDSGWDDFSPEALQALLSEMAAWLPDTTTRPLATERVSADWVGR